MSMGRRMVFVLIGVVIAVGFAAMIMAMLSKKAVATEGLAAHVDMAPFDRIAVHTPGRFKSFGSFSYESIGRIAGRERIAGQPRDFTYLDLMFRPQRYANLPMIRVKNKPMRAQLARALSMGESDEATFMDSGLLPRSAFRSPSVQQLLETWSQDLIKTAKHSNEIQSAFTMSEPGVLEARLAVVPPPNGDEETPWLTLGEFMQATTSPSQPPIVAGMDPGLAADLQGAIVELERSWVEAGRAGQGQLEAAGARVSAALANLSGLLAQVNPSVYPSTDRLAYESLYFEYASFTWVWVVYLLAAIFLLMAVAYRWDGARFIGLGLFGSAALMHTGALVLRWYVSGRWPNSNMFEAVTTSVWFGVVVAIVFEVVARRSSLRNFFALTGAFAAMAAMMSASFFSQLDPNISNMMPVLHDIWLYIHTNVIIASYALIAMASVTGGLYLIRRIFGGSADYAKVGGTGMLLEAGEVGGEDAEGNGPTDALRVDAPFAAPAAPKRSLGEVFDGATLVLMELSFVMLWAGIAMGAIWADHSWGRPWGWDPKEVFALNTFIVFVILIHVRMKTRDKGLWTAILAVIGCAVMLFNWIAINFVVSGLHSYA